MLNKNTNEIGRFRQIFDFYSYELLLGSMSLKNGVRISSPKTDTKKRFSRIVTNLKI